MPTYFNNCLGRDHADIYKVRPFFDLDTDGSQGSKANSLKSGESCVVLTETRTLQIIASTYKFSHEVILPDENNLPTRVLFGTLVQSETLTKTEAAAHKDYSILFDIRGRFKQVSALSTVETEQI